MTLSEAAALAAEAAWRKAEAAAGEAWRKAEAAARESTVAWGLRRAAAAADAVAAKGEVK